MILHGHARLTGDVGFFVSPSRDNPERLFAALEDFWEGDVPGLDGPADLGSAGAVVQFGRPPNRIDLMNTLDGVDFEQAWEGRVEAVMSAPGGDVPLPYIGLDALVRNKRAAGRPKDLDDLGYLTGELID